MTDAVAPAVRNDAAGNDAAIVTQGLVRRFGTQVAVDGLDLEVPRGSFYGFLGPNGAGKSTTINMLTGLLAPSAGQARILGLEIGRDTLEIKRRIGVVPDGLHLFERLTGEEQLEFVGRLYGLDRATSRQRARQLLEVMEMGADGRKLVAGYSHGMRKKLALSCALIHNPPLLFLDEPFEGIDAVATKSLRELLARLVRDGTTVFLTSHVLEVVERLCSHLAVIARGRLVAQGSLDELRRRPDGGQRSLEDLFLHLIGDRGRAGDGLTWLGTSATPERP